MVYLITVIERRKFVYVVGHSLAGRSWLQIQHSPFNPVSGTSLNKKYMNQEEQNLINQCNGDTKVETKYTMYGYENIYQIGGKRVTLSFQQYANGEDDYNDELVDVKVEKSLLDNLKEAVAMKPTDFLGK